MGHWLFICPKLLWVESCANTHSYSHSHPKSFIHSHVKTVGHHRHYHRIAAHRTTLQCIASLHFVLVVFGVEKKLWLITSHWRRCICNTFEPFNVAAPPTSHLHLPLFLRFAHPPPFRPLLACNWVPQNKSRCSCLSSRTVWIYACNEYTVRKTTKSNNSEFLFD